MGEPFDTLGLEDTPPPGTPLAEEPEGAPPAPTAGNTDGAAAAPPTDETDWQAFTRLTTAMRGKSGILDFLGGIYELVDDEVERQAGYDKLEKFSNVSVKALSVLNPVSVINPNVVRTETSGQVKRLDICGAMLCVCHAVKMNALPPDFKTGYKDAASAKTAAKEHRQQRISRAVNMLNHLLRANRVVRKDSTKRGKYKKHAAFEAKTFLDKVQTVVSKIDADVDGDEGTATGHSDPGDVTNYLHDLKAYATTLVNDAASWQAAIDDWNGERSYKAEQKRKLDMTLQHIQNPDFDSRDVEGRKGKRARTNSPSPSSTSSSGRTKETRKGPLEHMAAKAEAEAREAEARMELESLREKRLADELAASKADRVAARNEEKARWDEEKARWTQDRLDRMAREDKATNLAEREFDFRVSCFKMELDEKKEERQFERERMQVQSDERKEERKLEAQKLENEKLRLQLQLAQAQLALQNNSQQ